MLTRWLLLGEWRAHPLRAMVAVLAIAIGVALGFAIHLINAAALDEFGAAIKGLAGEADLQVRGTEPMFDEAIYPWLAKHEGVSEAGPVLEIQANIAHANGALKVIGLDVFRAADLSPQLLPMPNSAQTSELLADDAIFLSPAAGEWLHARPGAELRVLTDRGDIGLRVAGSLAQARAGQRLAVMDIGAAQWRLGRLGKLSHVDLRLEQGINRTAFQEALQRELNVQYPGRFLVAQPGSGDEQSKQENVSRAYRVNLTVLALVALFTGAFLVFSTQALSVVRRRGQFALLRVLGMERTQLLRQTLTEGLVLGMLGSAFGIAGGYGIAAVTLRLLGGDLGAGFFAGVAPQLHASPLGAMVYFALGLAIALVGCLAPAWDAANTAPAPALKSGAEESALGRTARLWPGLVCFGLALLCLAAPPVLELPIFGYLSVALLLVGGISLMPLLAKTVFGAVARLPRTWPAPITLALGRLANAPGQASIALGGVLSSFSLMVAMAIMVTSFRVSLDQWLGQVLPADLYIRSAMAGETAMIGQAAQAALARLPNVARADFLRTRAIQLAPERASVTLIARDIDPARIDQSLVLIGTAAPVPAGATPVWVSEAMVDIYGARPGHDLRLPLGGQLRDVFVAGVWRDYARPAGSIVLALPAYRKITGENDVTDAALYLRRGANLEACIDAIRALPGGANWIVAQPQYIRSLSLQIFDRSFAVTYLLEAVAIVIGLFGVAATFSGQTLARAREFGMLRHVGVTRGQILGLLALEGSAITALGIACGFGLGYAISLILVDVVNPQSFHWTMDVHLPWPLLGAVAAVLLAAATLTALGAGRQALSDAPIRAVREDW